VSAPLDLDALGEFPPERGPGAGVGRDRARASMASMYPIGVNPEEQNFADLLRGLTDRQVREFCIEAVRRVRSKGDKASAIG
jgi:hypothetical protein